MPYHWLQCHSGWGNTMPLGRVWLDQKTFWHDGSPAKRTVECWLFNSRGSVVSDLWKVATGRYTASESKGTRT